MKNKSDRVFKLPKGTFKDGLLKYNMLKLLATLAMIFGGLYLMWGAYFGYFSKTSLIDENRSIYTNAYVESTKSGGYYYYEIVKEKLTYDEFKILKNNDNNLVNKAYLETDDGIILSKSLPKNDYIAILELQKSNELFTKNIFTGQKMPEEVLKGDNFPIIFEISNPDHHFIGKVGKSASDIRGFLEESRKRNFVFMFLTPLIPILGFLWLFFSAKHTYKRQQEAERTM